MCVCVLVPYAQVLPTVFKWDGGGKQVFITGTFSNWKTLPMVKSHGDFVTIVDLGEGEHEYKFLVDGQWMHDPTEPVVENNLGTKNNIITVKKSDFEVFDALDIDQATSAQGPSDYGQEVPATRPLEKTTPPILPPHLLQVILNKDTPLSVSIDLLIDCWTMRPSNRTLACPPAPPTSTSERTKPPQKTQSIPRLKTNQNGWILGVRLCLGTVRADAAPRAEPRHVEPPVRAVDQRRRHGPLGHAPLPQKVRHHAALQTHLRTTIGLPAAQNQATTTRDNTH